jgi:hypothetical protein
MSESANCSRGNPKMGICYFTWIIDASVRPTFFLELVSLILTYYLADAPMPGLFISYTHPHLQHVPPFLGRATASDSLRSSI